MSRSSREGIKIIGRGCQSNLKEGVSISGPLEKTIRRRRRCYCCCDSLEYKYGFASLGDPESLTNKRHDRLDTVYARNKQEETKLKLNRGSIYLEPFNHGT